MKIIPRDKILRLIMGVLAVAVTYAAVWIVVFNKLATK